MSKRLISRLSIILFSSLMVIQSCQTPNNINNKFSTKATVSSCDRTYIVEATEIDDSAYVDVNGIRAAEFSYGIEKQTRDISSAFVQGKNIVNLYLNNDRGGFSYNFKLTENSNIIFEEARKSNGWGDLNPNPFIIGNALVKSIEVNCGDIIPTPTPTPYPTATPTPEPTPSDEPCDCTPTNSFGIKAYPSCDKKPCSDPLLYPNNDDPYKNCPSFAKDKKGNKSPFFPTESIVIGVYDFDSGENKPNLTVVLRPNGNNNHLGGFGENNGSGTSITQNNIDNTKVYMKDDTNKTNLLISDNKNPPKDPKENWDFNHDAKTGTIEINTHKERNTRASYDDILGKLTNEIEKKVITDLVKNLKTNSESSLENAVAGIIKPNGVISSKMETSRVDMTKGNDGKLYLPVLGIKLEDVIKTMKVGDTKTLILENQGNFIEINLKYKGNNKDNPNDSLWEVYCGRGN